ncbi:CvpA family protein [Niabella drilacis]|uniref:Membrane protein required for colicin V production n=1 Tax=Niabella drilacis (strain DSM 25811 / CCM 8410 / CCUG 62505 / LMG 26954 / E90) TaxID=1285928 RepID=A0A1G6Q364_NIADE|nr:CvpA family protein [Niabella drilacis]SDC86075.1 membrane protein required for colicin V production [Niabella drilacis]
MIIDLVFAVLLCLAVFKGYRKGLIVGLFSYLALVIGLAVAMKLSSVVAGKIGTIVKLSDKWLPVVAFVVVLLGVILLVKWVARLIQFSVEKIMLGWVNRFGGILLFAMLYIAVYSVLLFYLNQLRLLPEPAVSSSATFGFIEQFGKRVIHATGVLIPAFKNLFEQLEQFFN